MKKLHSLIFAMAVMLPLLFFTGCGNMQTNASSAAVHDLHEEVWNEWKAENLERLKQNLERGSIRQNGLEMKFAYSVFGAEPADGRSLWISLHGGGGAPTEVNDGQWENQKRLYQPAEGIYLSPRAPWDAWNMWFQEPIDSLFEELIATMVALKGVNPDKVYLLGYSAGGDGVWRLAPRLADHWAAASMMAGHPGDVSLLNVRNLPFMLWVGELDAAYDRNREVAMRGAELDSLQNTDPEGYVHECNVVEGKGHWMDLTDAAALPWMAQYKRNPYPDYIVWRQEEVLREEFYWLRAPKNEIERGKTAVIEVKDNVIDIIRCDYTSLTFLLNDSVVSLDEPVVVKQNGKVLMKKTLVRDKEFLHQSLQHRLDPRYMFDSELTIHPK